MEFQPVISNSIQNVFFRTCMCAWGKAEDCVLAHTLSGHALEWILPDWDDDLKTHVRTQEIKKEILKIISGLMSMVGIQIAW